MVARLSFEELDFSPRSEPLRGYHTFSSVIDRRSKLDGLTPDLSIMDDRAVKFTQRQQRIERNWACATQVLPFTGFLLNIDYGLQHLLHHRRHVVIVIVSNCSDSTDAARQQKSITLGPTPVSLTRSEPERSF
jgi:hypothetical protein